jgi:hypothetical protein
MAAKSKKSKSVKKGRGGARANAGRKPKEKPPEAPSAIVAPEPQKTGRPTAFTPELAEAVCDAVSTTPRGLDFICETNKAFPSARTVHRWLAAHESFRQSYVLARERQADLLFDECLEIADDSSGDTKIIGRDGEEREVMDAEFVARSKIRIDTRMRMAGKLAPKKYGEKTALELSGKDGAPLVPVINVTIGSTEPSPA